MQKCEKSKKMDFLQKLADTICDRKGEKKRAFSCTLSVLAKKFFGPKQCKPGKTIKNSGFSGNCPKAKMTPFFGKRCFLTWVKKWVLLTVFLKSCVSWKHNFYSVFSKNTAFQKQKLYVEKNRKFMKNSGLFLSMANGVFWVWFFWGLILKRFVFGVSGIVSKVLKMLVFPNFLGFSGVACYCSSGFGRFRCFCVFLCLFFFVVLLLFLFCLLCYWFCFLFCFLFCFFSLVFFCFFVCFVFFCFVFLEGLRVRWGGPKGHLTWPQTLLIFWLLLFVCCFFCFLFVFFGFGFFFFVSVFWRV